MQGSKTTNTLDVTEHEGIIKNRNIIKEEESRRL